VTRVKFFLLAIVGSFLGALARIFFAIELSSFHEEIVIGIGWFSISTFFVNFLGPFFIGLISKFDKSSAPTIYAFFHRGFLRGFTTFSAVGLELHYLLEARKIDKAGLYLLFTAIGGIMSLRLGSCLFSLFRSN
tara:strand:- start:102 stop:503 length:402 start_codon:yes stop_codon:yes gene_type:complete